jgi:hypothetical protein
MPDEIYRATDLRNDRQERTRAAADFWTDTLNQGRIARQAQVQQQRQTEAPEQQQRQQRRQQTP